MRADRAHTVRSTRITSAECFLQVATANFGKTELLFSMKELVFIFFDIGPANVYTAGHWHASMACTALQCVSSDRVRKAISTQIKSAGCFVLMAKANYGKLKFDLLENLRFNFLRGS